MKFLIAGLGNIGAEYADTRHNIGFMILDHVAQKNNLEFDLGRHAFHTSLKHKNHLLHFIKPTTYMNLSGKAIRYWMLEHSITSNNILVITDDLSLPFAKLRLKPAGSHGGHNGLRNIEETLETKTFPRLRVGIGDNFPKGRQVDYVLNSFTKEEQGEIPSIISKAEEVIFSFINIGMERTMNTFN